jgi:hypothetical protein
MLAIRPMPRSIAERREYPVGVSNIARLQRE